MTTEEEDPGTAHTLEGMPTVEKTQPPPIPEDAEKKALDQLGSWVKSQGKKTTGAKGWLWGLLVGAIALATVAFFYYRAWQRGKELAKLKHARDVQQQEQQRENIDMQLAADEAQKKRLLGQAELREKAISAINDEIQAVQARKERDAKDIDAIRSWRDFDRHISGK